MADRSERRGPNKDKKPGGGDKDGRRRREGGGTGGAGGGNDGRRRRDGGDDRRNRRKQPQAEEMRPVILAKPDRNTEFPTLQQAAAAIKKPATEAEASEAPSEVKVAPRVRVMEEDKARSNSPKLQQGPDKPQGAASAPIQPERCCKFVDDTQQISENLQQFLTDNQDFFVIGVLGPQSAGKSSLMSALALKEGLFRQQTFEKQLAAEHCTTGVNAWISPQRVIYLDCQGLNGPSVLDKLIQLEKKGMGSNPIEFGSPEATVEMQSLQLAGLFMSICHVVLVVQDWFADSDILQVLQTAEMLRPSSPAYVALEEDAAVAEYFPDVVFVQNKAELDNFTASSIKDMQELLSRVFTKSQLRLKGDMSVCNDSDRTLRHVTADSCDRNKINLFVLPEIPDPELEEGRFKSELNFDALVGKMRRQLLSCPRRPLTTSLRQTEKTWFQFAQKTWENIKNSSYYVEYYKLM